MRWLLPVIGLGRSEGGLNFDRLFGILFGSGLVLLALLVSRGLKNLDFRNIALICAVYLICCGLLLQYAVPDQQALDAPQWVLLAYIAAACLVFPFRLAGVLLLTALALNLLLAWINDLKIALTALPVTMLDLRIAGTNPAGLWNALDAPLWTLYLAQAGIAVTVVLILKSALTTGHRFLKGGCAGSVIPLFIGRTAAFGLILLLCSVYLESLYERLGAEENIWDPYGTTELYRRVGVFPFLAYSYHVESLKTGDIYAEQDATSPPDAGDIREAVLRYFRFDSGTKLRPNIVVFLAESTFNPEWAFRLTGQINNSLFRENKYTTAKESLIVNSVGGGTWIAEFETIVGIDTRLFGYSGFYTHSSISPFVTQSITTYLKERGYVTSAFFPHLGNFYNARRAYEHYGFEEIYDSNDLGRGIGWEQTDRDVVNDFLRTKGLSPAQPFFSYIISIENHAPHPCDVDSKYRFEVRFEDSDEFEPNCALNEYLRRMNSTADAHDALLRYLEDLHARTGRPFVLLVFGDHQPHTFTRTSNSFFNFDALRTDALKRETFFHLMSSTDERLKPFTGPASTTLLPTLLSGFVAKEPEDVYLGVNLWLFERCGADAIAKELPSGLQDIQLKPLVDRSESCNSAYERAVVRYRQAGIVNIEATHVLTDSGSSEIRD